MASTATPGLCPLAPYEPTFRRLGGRSRKAGEPAKPSPILEELRRDFAPELERLERGGKMLAEGASIEDVAAEFEMGVDLARRTFRTALAKTPDAGLAS